jgi:hypothetical protein
VPHRQVVAPPKAPAGVQYTRAAVIVTGVFLSLATLLAIVGLATQGWCDIVITVTNWMTGEVLSETDVHIGLFKVQTVRSLLLSVRGPLSTSVGETVSLSDLTQ